MRRRGLLSLSVVLLLLCAHIARAQTAEGTITAGGVQGFFSLNCPYEPSLQQLQTRYRDLPAPTVVQGQEGARTLDFPQLGLRLRVDRAGRVTEITVLAPEAIVGGRPPVPLVTDKNIRVGDSRNQMAAQYAGHPKVVGQIYQYSSIGFEISEENRVVAIILSGQSGGRCGAIGGTVVSQFA
jgi:hypothetical protein